MAGVAVGCGWQAFVAYVNVGCYYIVGIPLGCLLGFYFDLGAAVTSLLDTVLDHCISDLLMMHGSNDHCPM
jgi:Na+-driven multidrug efflux pump